MDINLFECEYCKKTFSTKSNLLNHKNTTKYCLQLQGKIGKNYICNLCEEEFTSNQMLQRHFFGCKKMNIRYEEKIKEKDKQIEEENKKIEQLQNREKILLEMDKELQEQKEIVREYQFQLKELENSLKEKNTYIAKLEEMLAKSNETIAEIAKQPTITNNTNNTNNKNTFLAVNFDIEDIEIIENILETHLTPSVLKLGQEGVADMLNNKLLKTKDGTPLYECTDVSRKNFEFRNQHGDIEIDPQANRLIRNLKRSNISQIAGKMGKGIWTKEENKAMTNGDKEPTTNNP